MDDAQREIVAFLRDPSSHPADAGPVDIIETHASIVFLAGARAYKLKRAVKYPYLDFSTAARRRAACAAELMLNRRTAPQLYLEVRAISRQAGRVRRCHGDLHLRNICLVDGRPLLFDCVEFSEELASIDVLYDLAFLLMDLGHRGDQGLANLVLNRYLDLTEEDDGLALMP